MPVLPDDAPHPPHGMPYVGVDDADAATARGVELGGVDTIPPTDTPEVGRCALNPDPHAALFSVIAGT
jgi:predicted enzyme related to lactoylglutathione lyase